MPDAVVLVDGTGTITSANRHACGLFGYRAEELVGQPVEILLPASLRDRHIEHRDRFVVSPTSRPMAEGQDLHAQHRDGHEIPVDIALAPMTTAEGSMVAAFVRDATVRRRAVEARQRLHDAEVARKHALEVNDNVLQGLTTALWQLETEDLAAVSYTLNQTLEASRQMVEDLLDRGAPAVHPGDLVRLHPAPAIAASPDPHPSDGASGRIRVVLADDAADLRHLLRARLSKLPDVEVVAEAADGEEAVELVARLGPDVIVMDLSMPRLDGLQAAERLREEHPDVRVIVLSGYPTETMRGLALAAGAHAYIEKGPDMSTIEDAVRLARTG